MNKSPTRPNGDRRCRATNKKTGKQCGQWALRGTTVCRYHGGGAKHVRKAATKRDQLERVFDTYGLPREVDPHTALLEELHRTAGHVAWLGQIVVMLDTDEGKGKLLEKTMFGEQPAVWIKLLSQERKHLIDVAKACVAAGIAERQVKLAETQGQIIATVIQAVLTDLGVADKPEVPAIVRRHLSLAA